MEIKVRKIDSNAVIPIRAHDADAGYDLTAVSSTKKGYGLYQVRFGIALEIPVGYAGFLFPRSSVYKKGLSLANCVGVIDSGYRGEIKAMFYDVHRQGLDYAPGERCAQLIIMPIPQVEYTFCEELSDSDRAEGSFGSTGLNNE